MKRTTTTLTLALLFTLLTGCGGDRENPTAKTEADRLMESYLASVQEIGELLSEVRSESEAQTVTPRVLLIIEDMRRLIPQMKAIEVKDQADAISKYRVKINKVNEQFAKDITHFVNIPGASEDLIEQLRNLPSMPE